MKNIILASQSPRRRQLLQQIGLKFSTVAANINEDISTDYPQDMVQQIACSKARAVEKMGNKGIIIAADTVVVLEGRVMGKPVSREDAFNKLRSLSGKQHQVITGVCVLDTESNHIELASELTNVYFRSLSDEEIVQYVSSGEPDDKAGAYGIQGLGAVMVERIEGCYFNVVGLPLNLLCLMLKKQGINVLRG